MFANAKNGVRLNPKRKPDWICYLFYQSFVTNATYVFYVTHVIMMLYRIDIMEAEQRHMER